MKKMIGFILFIGASILGLLLYIYDYVFHGTIRRQPYEQDGLMGIEFGEYAKVINKCIEEFKTIPYEKVTIQSRDGIRLAGRYYHFKDGAPISIVFHGYRGNVARDGCGGFRMSRDNGFNVLLINQRAHFESGGRTITFGVKERYDCLDWIEYVRERFGKDTPVMLMGLSMGAAVVLMAGGLDLPSNVKGIFADCGYTSPKEILQTVIKQMKLPVKISYFFVRLSAIIFGGFDPEEASAKEALKNCKIPVMFVHGEADDFVPCQMSRDNYEACASRKEILTVPGAKHGMSYCIDSEAYVNAVQKFMDSIMEKSDIQTTVETK